jgi:hypothetical protein
MKEKIRYKILLVLLLILFSAFMFGCSRSANRAAYNLDIAAEEFQLNRRIVAVNGITDKPLFEIIGQCSIETSQSYVTGAMEVVCKTGDKKFSKHFIYLSDNVLIMVEQLDTVYVPQYHYQMVFAPQSILPIPVIITGDD